MNTVTLFAALRDRRPFKAGQLTGSPVTPWNRGRAYNLWQAGSVGRMFAGALNEIGTAGVITSGGASPLPELGMLDPAPAMGLALGEASYIVRSYDTPVAWWLGAEVCGAAPVGSARVGEWIEVAQRCNDDYGRFSAVTTRHQNQVHAALTYGRKPGG